MFDLNHIESYVTYTFSLYGAIIFIDSFYLFSCYLLEIYMFYCLLFNISSSHHGVGLTILGIFKYKVYEYYVTQCRLLGKMDGQNV